MDCAKAATYLHSYIDDSLSAMTRRELEQHLLACPACSAELEAMLALSRSLRALPQPELPPGFSQALHEKLAAEPPLPRPAIWQRGWAKGMVATAGLVLVISALAMGGNALSKNFSTSQRGFGMASFDLEAPMAYESAPMPAPTAAVAPAAIPAPASDMMIADDMLRTEEAVSVDALSGKFSEGEIAAGEAEKQLERKIIKDANLSLRVEDFAAAYQRLNELAVVYGGYVVSSDAYGYDGEMMQRGYVMLRVEAARLDEAIAEIESLGQLENQSVYTQDITMTYYDIEGRLEQYQTQEQRLLEIMSKAETVEDLIKLESELTRVRAELESLTGQLRYYDQMTSLSSINVSLYQPDSDTQTLRLSGWERFTQDLREGFISGINGLLRGLAGLAVGFTRLLPLLLLVTVIVLALIWILRRRRK